MSGPKFGSLTANFLVRKGEAAPSAVAPAAYFTFPRGAERADMAHAHPAEPEVVEAPPAAYRQAAEWHDSAPRTELFERSGSSTRDLPAHHDHHPAHHDHHMDKPRRLMVSLSPEEYETLGIIAVKQGVTRHQLLRMALDDYLEDLIQECGRSCDCIATGWACGTPA